MSLSPAKISLTGRLLETDTEVLIKHLTAIIDSYWSDFWDELSNYQKKLSKHHYSSLKMAGKYHTGKFGNNIPNGLQNSRVTIDFIPSGAMLNILRIIGQKE